MPRKQRRARRWIFFAILSGITILVAGYFYLTSSQRISRLVSEILHRTIGADVQIQAARISLAGTVVLDDIDITVPGFDEPANTLFSARQVKIDHSIWALLTKGFNPRTIRFVEPTLSIIEIIESVDASRFNYELLRPEHTDVRLILPDCLPEIYLRDGSIRFGMIEGNQYEQLGEVHLSGNLTAHPDQPGAYFYDMRQKHAGSEGAILSGTFDLKGPIFESRLENFAFESQHRNMLKRQWRAYWDQLNPKGQLPTIHVTYGPGQGLRAELAAQDVELTLPYVGARIQVQSARFSLTGPGGSNENRDAQVTITDLKGQIEDIQYVINGRVFGFEEEAPFELRVESEGTIPTQPRYLVAMPENLRKIFHRYSPSGRLEGAITLTRKQPGGPVSYNGRLEVAGAFLYSKFPYPLDAVWGALAFNDQQFQVESLTGKGPTGASIHISGTITPPVKGAAIEMTITSTDAPIDQALFRALKSKHRKIVETFMDQAHYQRLVEAGLIQSRQQQQQRRQRLEQLALQRLLVRDRSEEEALAQLDRQIVELEKQVDQPVFELGGVIAAVTRVSRELGQKKSRVITELNLAGSQWLLRDWPYPISITSGQVVLEPSRALVRDLRGQGLNGGWLELSGWVDLAGEGRSAFEPHLNIVAKDIPIDELLVASLSHPQNQWVQEIQPKGTLAAEGRIFRNEGGQIDFLIDTHIIRGTARPYGGRLELENILGKLTLRRRSFQIHELVGRHNGSTVNVSGSSRWSTGEPVVNLVLYGQDLHFDDALLDLLPPQQGEVQALRKVIASYKPEGEFHANLRYMTGGQKGRRYELTLWPLSLAFDLRGTRIALRDMSGQVHLTSDIIELQQIAGKFNEGTFSTTGTVRLREQLSVDLTFDAKNRRCCPVTRAVLPSRVLETIQALDLDGAYQVRGARLRVRPTDPEQPDVSFDARVALRDAKAVVGVPITQMDGDVEVHLSSRLGDHFPTLALTFEANHLRAADRLISPLSIHLANHEQPELLEIRRFRGECYGGSLSGSGIIRLDTGGEYVLKLIMEDAAFDPVLWPDRYTHSGASAATSSIVTNEKEPGLSGVLSASLTIKGVPNDPTSRRGRGELRISGAKLYEVPLVLAVLQLLNLTLPTSTAFDRADATYLVDGDLVRLDRVNFVAPSSVEIVGAGTMQVSTRALDMVMFSRNPGGPRFGLLSELIDKFKDELVCVQVKGTLGAPDAKLVSFRGITQSWREIFGRSERSDQPIAGTSARSGQ